MTPQIPPGILSYVSALWCIFTQQIHPITKTKPHCSVLEKDLHQSRFCFDYSWSCQKELAAQLPRGWGGQRDSKLLRSFWCLLSGCHRNCCRRQFVWRSQGPRYGHSKRYSTSCCTFFLFWFSRVFPATAIHFSSFKFYTLRIVASLINWLFRLNSICNR